MTAIQSHLYDKFLAFSCQNNPKQRYQSNFTTQPPLSTLPFPIPSTHLFLPCPALPSPAQTGPTLPSPAQPRLTLSYPILPFPALHFPSTLPYASLPLPTLPWPTLPYPGLPYPSLPYPTLPYPTLPYPTLVYPTLPYPTLPYPTSSLFINAEKVILGACSAVCNMPDCRSRGHELWIPAQSHIFVEIDHEIISTDILLPSTDSRRVVVS